jgi:hypothetical protein
VPDIRPRPPPGPTACHEDSNAWRPCHVDRACASPSGKRRRTRRCAAPTSAMGSQRCSAARRHPPRCPSRYCPSPSGRLSRPRSTTAAPLRPDAHSGRRTCPPVGRRRAAVARGRCAPCRPTGGVSGVTLGARNTQPLPEPGHLQRVDRVDQYPAANSACIPGTAFGLDPDDVLDAGRYALAV